MSCTAVSNDVHAVSSTIGSSGEAVRMRRKRFTPSSPDVFPGEKFTITGDVEGGKLVGLFRRY